MFGTISQALTQPDYIVCMCQGNVGKVNIKTQMHYAYGMLWHHFQQVDLLLKALGFCTLQRKGEQIAIKKKKRFQLGLKIVQGFVHIPFCSTGDLEFWSQRRLQAAQDIEHSGKNLRYNCNSSPPILCGLSFDVACVICNTL